ncbi:MAG: hypothetical protein ACRDJU_08140, partial [Actinomycetota bacterium]
MDELALLREVFAEPCEPSPGAWAEVDRRVSARIAAIEQERRRPLRGGRRIRRRPSLTRWAVGMAVALCAALLAVAALQRGTAPGPAAPAWRLAGTISAPGFGAATAPSGDAQNAEVTCAAPGVCYVVLEGSLSGPDDSNVAITTDGGVSWQHPSLPPGVVAGSRFSCVSASVCSAGASLLDPASGPEEHPGGDPQLLTTSDGGATWRAVPVPAPTAPMPGGAGGADYAAPSAVRDLACFSAQSCLLTLTYVIPEPTRTNAYQYSEGAMVMRTDDAGAHWSSAKLPRGDLGNAGADTPTISCSSAQICVVSGGDQLIGGRPDRIPMVWTTEDGGATWSVGALPQGVLDSPGQAPSCP